MNKPQFKIFLADYLNPTNDKTCKLVRQGALVAKLKADGDYSWCFIGSEKNALEKYSSKKSIEVTSFPGGIISPAFFDMHFHWVQDDVRTMPKDNLLTWLSKYTWPFEAKFKDLKFSSLKAKHFTKRLLSNGTLGGACYASIHGHSVDHALNNFVGDYIVGNVLMTMNSPDYLSQTKKQALKLVLDKGRKFKKLYALTPRFAPTTHPEVMLEGARIARQNKSFIQTHLSETSDEIEYVLSIFRKLPGFRNVKSYTEIYKKCKLLGSRTIMGHAIHLSSDELTLLSKSKTAVAHCPTSNAPVEELGLGSGLFNFKKAERAGVRWALASDIGGGPFLSMLDVMNSFVKQNKKNKVSGATYVKALFRSTQAGAELLKLGKTRGNFALKKQASFIVLEKPMIKKADTAEEVLKKIISKSKRDALDKKIWHTFYNGESVFSRG